MAKPMSDSMGVSMCVSISINAGQEQCSSITMSSNWHESTLLLIVYNTWAEGCVSDLWDQAVLQRTWYKMLSTSHKIRTM